MTAESRHVQVGSIDLHYLEEGTGEATVLVHGWPTSSYLWRDIVPALAAGGRVLAPDLPGFGLSDKPEQVTYTLDFQAGMLGAFLDAVGARRVSLVLHDLGGPIGLLWAVRNPHRLRRLVVMNTIVYRDGPARLYWAEGGLARRLRSILADRRAPLASRLLVAAAHAPGLGHLVFSGLGVAGVMRAGVTGALAPEAVAAYVRPYATAAARRVLRKTFLDPRLAELDELEQGLHRLTVPALLLRATRDRLLPGVASELERLARDLPGARLEVLRGCGHFLQEDDPATIGGRIAQFLAEDRPA